MICEFCKNEVKKAFWVKPMDDNRFYLVCKSCRDKEIQIHKKWRVFRQKIFKRDNYTCYDCKTKQEGNNIVLQVHHISRREVSPDLIFVPSNCITLCRECHKERHDEAQSWIWQDPDEEILCKMCGVNYHKAKYEMCYSCYQERQ